MSSHRDNCSALQLKAGGGGQICVGCGFTATLEPGLAVYVSKSISDANHNSGTKMDAALKLRRRGGGAYRMFEGGGKRNTG